MRALGERRREREMVSTWVMSRTRNTHLLWGISWSFMIIHNHVQTTSLVSYRCGRCICDVEGKAGFGRGWFNGIRQGVLTLCTSLHKQTLHHHELKPTQVLMVDKYSRLPLNWAVVLFMIAGGEKKLVCKYRIVLSFCMVNILMF